MNPDQIAELVRVGRVGFTGTRDGMTDAQKATVEEIVVKLRPSWAHHGDCVGADGDFHQIAKRHASVMIHPPSDPKLRARLVGDDIAEEKPYLDRNRDIVHAADVLIATPRTTAATIRGGTWYTVKYARRMGKTVVIVWPDGSTLIDGSGGADA